MVVIWQRWMIVMTDAKAIVLLEGLFVYIVRSIKEKTLSTYIDQNTVLSYVGKYHVTVHWMVPIDTCFRIPNASEGGTVVGACVMLLRRYWQIEERKWDDISWGSHCVIVCGGTFVSASIMILRRLPLENSGQIRTISDRGYITYFRLNARIQHWSSYNIGS